MGRRRYGEWSRSFNGIFSLLESSRQSHLELLDEQVLSVLWHHGSATVHEVINRGQIPRAYNTVLTRVDRLYRRRLLERTAVPGSRSFRYFPRHRTRAEWQRESVIETVKQLLNMHATSTVFLSYAVEAIREHDAGLLVSRQGGERRSSSANRTQRFRL